MKLLQRYVCPLDFQIIYHAISEEPILPVSNGTEFYFSSCGAYGKDGPNQQQCDYSYRYEDLLVTVLGGDMAGVQLWVVPETGPFR